jgi:hypothetical protein
MPISQTLSNVYETVPLFHHCSALQAHESKAFYLATGE